MILAVAKKDAPGAVALLQQLAQQEWDGTTDTADEPVVEGACPACGTVSKESDEICSDCGLRLR
ncbi:MAG: hypothetical protein VYD70_05400 [Planctomycetota bacterium]|nr:hypothetical protein [Planctomycetota bacterium]